MSEEDRKALELLERTNTLYAVVGGCRGERVVLSRHHSRVLAVHAAAAASRRHAVAYVRGPEGWQDMPGKVVTP